jgi:hypothetical protein
MSARRDRRSLPAPVSTQTEAGHERQVRLAQVALSSARRRESRLLRRLGRRALDALSRGASMDPEDLSTRLIVEELERAHREIALLGDRLRRLETPFSPEEGAFPPSPGTDRRFPFGS